MPRRVLLCALALSILSLSIHARPAAGAPPPAYLAPVDAPVVDPFRPPAGPYAAGNRGLEYGTAPGAAVRAAAGGVVTFAGTVAGTRHVTVLHPDGLRTSYSFLATVEVVVGQRLSQGERLGTTAGHLHLGARAGDAYLDPSALFGTAQVRVRLVPFDEPPGTGPSGERNALLQLIGGVGGVLKRGAEGLVDKALRGTGATADWLRQEGGHLLRTAAHYMSRIQPGSAQLHLLLAGVQAWGRAGMTARRDCTPADRPVPRSGPGRRKAILVGGLGSSSDNAAIDELDTPALGYEAPDVVRFSYAGGRTPGADGPANLPTTTYEPADTQVDPRASARGLADLIEAFAAEQPGTPIDLYAHSLGGLVVRLALIELEARHGTEWLRRLGLVATLGTPHGGADLATAIHAVGTTGTGSSVFDGVELVPGVHLDDDAPAITALSETSDLVADLADTPLPEGVQVVSIAARGDLIVPVPRTLVPGATQVVVPVDGISAHDALPGSPEAHRELALALGGRPPTCVSFAWALLGQLTGEGISWVEDMAGALAWFGASRVGRPLGG
ncbi:MAG: peptidoglycan DD-metalloendopeptidase family protein [Actinomycetota bacterium]